MRGDTLGSSHPTGCAWRPGARMWSCFRPCSRTRAPEGGVPPEKVALADAAWTRADVQPRSRAFPPLNPRVWKAPS